MCDTLHLDYSVPLRPPQNMARLFKYQESFNEVSPVAALLLASRLSFPTDDCSLLSLLTSGAALYHHHSWLSWVMVEHLQLEHILGNVGSLHDDFDEGERVLRSVASHFALHR